MSREYFYFDTDTFDEVVEEEGLGWRIENGGYLTFFDDEGNSADISPNMIAYMCLELPTLFKKGFLSITLTKEYDDTFLQAAFDLKLLKKQYKTSYLHCCAFAMIMEENGVRCVGDSIDKFVKSL